MTHAATLPGLALATLLTLAGPIAAETPAPTTTPDEDAFLDILPKVAVPEDVQPIPGAMNEEFRNCKESWPAGYEQARSGPESRALRDIYGLVRAQNVISAQDCTCSGKVANWNDVEAIAAALREHFDVTELGWRQTEAISNKAKSLIAVAETMCGGAF